MRNVIFDLDGTLVDSLPGIQWSVARSLEACGLAPLSRDLKPLIGPPIRSILSTVTGIREPRMLDTLEQAFRTSYDSAGWSRTRLYPGVEDLLWLLDSNGIDLWVVTNKPSRVSARILSQWNLAGFFQEISCRDSHNPPFASKSEVLRDLVDRRALCPAECLMVGDTIEDCHAAEACGIPCVLVAHGYGAEFPSGYRPVSGWDEVADLCGALCAVER